MTAKSWPSRLAFFLFCCAPAFSQTAATHAPTVEERLNALDTATKSAQLSADNAWMLTSAALVLMMTGPGLALFYGGLVRAKNVLNTMMNSFVLMAVVTVLWAVYGYSLAFAPGSPFIGGFQYLFLNGVGSAPNTDYGPTVPHATYMIYQLMFAIITPALISGAFAERMKFSAMLLFTCLWSTLIYFPMAHMVWGKGGLLNAFLGGSIPTFDFAGGTDEAAQSSPQHDRCVPSVGGLVRLQRGQRSSREHSRNQRIRSHSFRRGIRHSRLAPRRMVQTRQAQHVGRYLRRSRRLGSHNARFRLR